MTDVPNFSHKKPLPWFPFNVKAYVTDTMRLSTEAHGAYLLLMLDYYSTAEAPPDDDEVLATICKLPADAWAKHRKVLAPFFEITEGRWIHSRIEAEMLEACDKHSRAVAKAAAAADARWGKNAKGKAPSMPQAPAEQRKRPSRAKGNAPDMPVASTEQSLENAQEQEHSLSTERESLSLSKAVDQVGEVEGEIVSVPTLITDTMIAPDFRPRADLIAAAMDDAAMVPGMVPANTVEHELSMFIAYMQDKGAFSANWDAAWVKWWGRWRDRQVAPPKPARAPARVMVNKQPEPADFEQAVMRFSKNNSHWSRHLGPEPGMTGCKCPPDILVRHGIDPKTGLKARQETTH